MSRAATLASMICAGLLLAGTAAAETVTLERDTQLRAEPSLSAPAGATLKQGARAELIEKRGVWINVKSADASGWLFVFNVRYGERQAGSGQGDAAAVGRLVSARPVTGVTSTIGVRGLSEEDLQRASFNAAEMQLLDGYAATRESAEQQAGRGNLQPARVEYFGAQK